MGRRVKTVDSRVAVMQAQLGESISGFGRVALNGECTKLCLKLLDAWAKHDPDAPLRYGIALATLDNDPGVRPAAHIFVSSKAPWFTITDDLPQFAERPEII